MSHSFKIISFCHFIMISSCF